MQFRFQTKELKDLYITEKGIQKYPPDVANSFFEIMDIIAAAKDERDLYALKSLHFEKLVGNRQGQHSLRLNIQWRLIVTIEKVAQEKWVVVISIENHYKK